MAASAYRENLPAEIALMTIKYVAPITDIFSLASAITYAAKCVLRNDGSVPAPLRNAVKEDIIDGNIIKTIDGLSDYGFRDYLSYVVNCDDVKNIHYLYCEPIIRNIYQRNLVPASFLFATMGSHLSFSLEEELMNHAVIVPVTDLM